MRINKFSIILPIATASVFAATIFSLASCGAATKDTTIPTLSYNGSVLDITGTDFHEDDTEIQYIVNSEDPSQCNFDYNHTQKLFNVKLSHTYNVSGKSSVIEEDDITTYTYGIKGTFLYVLTEADVLNLKEAQHEVSLEILCDYIITNFIDEGNPNIGQFIPTDSEGSQIVIPDDETGNYDVNYNYATICSGLSASQVGGGTHTLVAIYLDVAYSLVIFHNEPFYSIEPKDVSINYDTETVYTFQHQADPS
ncbi:MAG: hypothetical protein LBM76_00910 [Mycoplasmataceae bacterium]|jgi:hypothetical protein|nr:hypothetical protein [Mycoplasmataceae bacterium]